MKKKLLLLLICPFFLWNGSMGNNQNRKYLNLHFSVSKCSYGIKAHLDSIAFEIEKPLIKEWNIKVTNSAKRPYIKNYEAGNFRVQILMSFKDSLIIRVFEEKKGKNNSTTRFQG